MCHVDVDWKCILIVYLRWMDEERGTRHKDLCLGALHTHAKQISIRWNLFPLDKQTPQWKALYAVREECFSGLDGKHKLRTSKATQKLLRSNFRNIFFATSTVAGAISTKNFNAGENTSMNLICFLMLSLFAVSITSLHLIPGFDTNSWF